MVLPPRNGLSLCAGGGGLDMGVELACPSFATTGYVEIEEYPRSTLIAGQKAGYLKPAPIWDDLKQFNGRPWRGIVDAILAGYPCQPFSQAGQRQGINDPRHLWPDIMRIIDEIGPAWVILENVQGHVSLGAESVLRDLRGMGFTPAVGLFTAAETGAPHERKRWFCLAYNHVNAQQFADRQQSNIGADGRHHVGGGCGKAVANTGGRRPCGQGEGQDQQSRGTEAVGTITELVNTAGIGCIEGRSEPKFRRGRDTITSTSSPVADAKSIDGRRELQSQSSERGRARPTGSRPELADTSPARLQRPAKRGDAGPASQGNQPAARFGRVGVHPPGPADANAWAAIIADAPDWAPSTSFGDIARQSNHLAQMVASGELAETEVEPDLLRMVDGLAQRSCALKLLGNGVHPLAAANAIRSLGIAHGLRPMDLGADG